MAASCYVRWPVVTQLPTRRAPPRSVVLILPAFASIRGSEHRETKFSERKDASGISFMPTLSAANSELLDALRDGMQTILEAMSLHCILGEEEAVANFREQLDAAGKALAAPATAKDIKATAKKAAAFERYNQRAAQTVRSDQSALRPTIAALTQTVAVAGEGAEFALVQLDELMTLL